MQTLHTYQRSFHPKNTNAPDTGTFIYKQPMKMCVYSPSCNIQDMNFTSAGLSSPYLSSSNLIFKFVDGLTFHYLFL